MGNWRAFHSQAIYLGCYAPLAGGAGILPQCLHTDSSVPRQKSQLRQVNRRLLPTDPESPSNCSVVGLHGIIQSPRFCLTSGD